MLKIEINGFGRIGRAILRVNHKITFKRDLMLSGIPILLI